MATDGTQTFGEKMLALMNERGISLRALARTTHYDPGYLSKVANDKKRPSRQLVDDLDAFLNANGDLAALTPPKRTKPKSGHDLANAPVGMTPSPTPDLGDDDVKRRAALQLLAALGAGAVIPPGIDNALGDDRLDLADWERVVHDYDHRIHSSPAGALIGDLTADIIALDASFERRPPPLQQAGLLRVSAAFSGLLAIEFIDAGDPRAARVAWATASRAADGSGDKDLRVWVRGRAAQDALFTGRSPHAVDALAQEAIDIADGTPSHGLARAHAARLDLATLRGDHGTLATALTDLRRTFERLPESQVPQSVFDYRETQYRWSESFLHVLTHDKRAHETLDNAFALYPSNALAPRTNLGLMRAIDLVKNREIDAGLQHALEILNNSTRGSAGGRLLTNAILGALPEKARVLPAARELRGLARSV